MQESLGAAAVGHQEANRLGVGPEVLVPPAALGHRQVDDVVEVGRNPGEVAVGQVDGFAPHAGLLEAVPRRAVGEAGDAPYLVVGRKRLGDGSGDLPGRTRDQDFGAAHAVIVSDAGDDYSVALIGPTAWQVGSVVKSKMAPQPRPVDS